jgi:O-methyltransferase involved in polyketide biosynthesis
VVWVAEGLLAYLSVEVRDALIETAAALSVPGSRLGLTLAAPDGSSERGEANAAGGTARPRNYRALFRSSAPEDPREWLAARGWQADFFDLAERSDSYGRPSAEGDGGVGRARLVAATRV